MKLAAIRPNPAGGTESGREPAPPSVGEPASNGAIVFEELLESDIVSTSALHTELMPLDLATRLGNGIVREIFHKGTRTFPGGLGVVAKANGRVVGFCLAHIDFRRFARHQRRNRVKFYGLVLRGVLRRPWLLREMFGAERYLALEPVFTNLGPLLVHPDYRTVTVAGGRSTSLATELARRVFEMIGEAAPGMPVLTMIRPSNMPSISAVAQAARLAGFLQYRRLPVRFGSDERIVFGYRRGGTNTQRATPLVDELAAALRKSLFPFLAQAIETLSARPGYRDQFESMLHIVKAAFPEKPWPKWPANGLLKFNRVVLQEEAEFRASGKYAKSVEEFSEVKSSVYDAADVMDGYYLVGLLLTYYTWEHHQDILEYYNQAFLERSAGGEWIMEWGVGHGLYTLLAARKWPQAEITAVDVSEHSLNFSGRVLAYAEPRRKVAYVLGDILDESLDLPVVDRLICSELLEHVPDPRAVVRRIAACLRPGGFAFVTAAVNAGQPDHIFLFTSPEEVAALFKEAGLRIDSLISTCHPKHRGQSDAPTVVALVAVKEDVDSSE